MVAVAIATCLVIGCSKSEYREKTHVTHVKIEKTVDYQVPPITISPEDQQEMEDFQEANINDAPPINLDVYYIKCTI